jgi:N-acetylglucosaminyldiphosphoundecaprenol N-acetyl-beta-D-mannosaminyltransferase
LQSSPDGDQINRNSSENPADRSRVNILGTKVDRVGMGEAVRRVMEFAESRTPHHVITLNAEMIERAQDNPDLRALINAADLVTPDGAGVVWASRCLGRPVPERVTGIDLMLELAGEASRAGRRVFLLGAAPGVADEAAERLRARYPGLNLVGTCHGYFSAAETPAIVERVRDAAADILFVALGAPKQEYWIRDNLGDLGVSVAIGVGGSFDVIAGRVKRAPAWMRKLQLEWLGRLVREPSRFRRMLALPRFALRVVGSRRDTT